MRTAASSRTSPRPARPSPPSRPGCRAPRSPRPATTSRRVLPCSRAPRWPPRRPPAPRRCCSSARQARASRRSPRRSCAGVYSHREVPARTSRRTPRATACSTSRAPGSCCKDGPRRPGRTPSSAPVCTPISDFLATPSLGHRHLQPVRHRRGGSEARPDEDLQRQGHPYQRAGRRDRATTSPGSATTAPSSSPASVVAAAEQAVTRQGRGQGRRRACTARSCRSTTRPPRASTSQIMNTVVVVQRRREARVHVHRDGHGPAQPHQVVLRHGARRARSRCRSTSAASPTGTQTRFIAIHPYGVPAENTSTPNCYPNYVQPGQHLQARRARRTTTRCRASGRSRSRRGARRRCWTTRSSSRAEVQGVTVTPAVGRAAERHGRRGDAGHLDRDQQLRSGRGQGSGRSARQRARAPPTIADRADQTYTVVVPAGATPAGRRDRQRQRPRRRPRPVRPQRGRCRVGQSADGDSEESVSIANPAAGTYTVVVDGYAVPSGTTAVRLPRRVLLAGARHADRAVDVGDLANRQSTTISGTVTAARRRPPDGCSASSWWSPTRARSSAAARSSSARSADRLLHLRRPCPLLRVGGGHVRMVRGTFRRARGSYPVCVFVLAFVGSGPLWP